MMTVRFPNGFSVQYNTANYIENGTGYHRLMTKKDGALIARVPSDAIVECVPPCRVYNAAADDTLRQFRSEMDALRKEIRSLKRKLVKP